MKCPKEHRTCAIIIETMAEFDKPYYPAIRCKACLMEVTNDNAYVLVGQSKPGETGVNVTTHCSEQMDGQENGHVMRRASKCKITIVTPAQLIGCSNQQCDHAKYTEFQLDVEIAGCKDGVNTHQHDTNVLVANCASMHDCDCGSGTIQVELRIKNEDWSVGYARYADASYSPVDAKLMSVDYVTMAMAHHNYATSPALVIVHELVKRIDG